MHQTNINNILLLSTPKSITRRLDEIEKVNLMPNEFSTDLAVSSCVVHFNCQNNMTYFFMGYCFTMIMVEETTLK